MKVKASEATHAVCKTCGDIVTGNWLWSVRKSVYLHESSATGHKMEYRI